MDWMECEAAFADLPSGTRFVAGNASGTPHTLLAALAAHALRVGGLTLRCGLLLGDVNLETAVRAGCLTVRSWHVPATMRRLYREGLVEYTPVRLLDIPERVLAVSDVALVRVGPPDADGWCSLGPSTSYARQATESVPLVIAEVTEHMPRTHGDSLVHVSRIDRFVRSATPLPTQAPDRPDATGRALAALVVPLLPPGATVQLGIGKVPDAIAAALAEDDATDPPGLLGLVTDAMRPLIDRIARAGGRVRALELIGSDALLRWAHDNPVLQMADSQELHNPLHLARVPNLISINSAIAVDVRGQVVAESVAGAVIAGVGGSADFAEGAHLSPGGMRIIALSSTTRTGASTIVAHHGREDVVTAAHHSVDVVATEHGLADLRGASVRERRDALIAIATPEHREALRASP
ncbi:hypothetical protein NQ156_10355 [Microbacterium sp. zg.Y625]|uniref:acetyl-CoA hydrolase/transferase family protein n=1 Tax=Microbacterium jiangjiandongii TaxID=3049071 RepID=UPI00214C8611|nr:MULTISPECIES: acetyl-CoA hydrolase/transferase C-terminal domain-containing protein [unclassified Microbacterium]MCR2793462.1 hypothetical protein [Microbacterium sp. zg.Y625]WIM25167.1 acetyl-CoA hydrolase/transferase C-terminal domain-containing protein [Microbacterium sp. zg-Y625]